MYITVLKHRKESYEEYTEKVNRVLSWFAEDVIDKTHCIYERLDGTKQEFVQIKVKDNIVTE